MCVIFTLYMLEIFQNIDQENYFFYNINTNCYYTEHQVHINIKCKHGRSQYMNIQRIKEYFILNFFKRRAVSEAWLKADKGLDFHLYEYELNYIKMEEMC